MPRRLTSMRIDEECVQAFRNTLKDPLTQRVPPRAFAEQLEALMWQHVRDYYRNLNRKKETPSND